MRRILLSARFAARLAVCGQLVLLLICIPAMSKADEHLVIPSGHKVDLSKNCPVCGMRVGGEMSGAATYAFRDDKLVGFAGVAAAVLKNNTVMGFEGTRCLFIFNTSPQKLHVDPRDIIHRFVMDFDSKKMIDANGAYVVLGSTIKGPMGYEVVAFSTKERAEKFSAEYGGKRVVQLGTITAGDVDRRKESPEKR